ncbi:MAG: hypothetical protein EOO07_17655 [Chitinophagaceae bacterium]|nr:MAG: hypothetical protein EOO07_17655 [Chitinophagaceae bacterium]
MLFIRHVDELFLPQSAEIIPDKVYVNEASRKLDEIFSQKSKFVLLLFVPFAALNSFLLFRKKSLNLSEHSIIAGMILLGILLISTLGHVVFLANQLTQFSWELLSMLVTAVLVLYVGFGYFNAFGKDYTGWQFGYRILLFFALICLETFIMLFFLVGHVTDWKFGPIVISPFS